MKSENLAQYVKKTVHAPIFAPCRQNNYQMYG